MTLATVEPREYQLPSVVETQSQLTAIRAFQEACRRHLIKGSDYGKIEGTDRDTLFKPGAEKIKSLLGLADTYEVTSQTMDWDRPLFHFEITCRLVHISTGDVVASGMGECNSMESKYRWRWVFQSELDRAGIGKDGLRTRQINTSRGKSTQYRIENEDIYSQVNTLLKMSKKRALVDAVLSAGRLSDIFTQDLEDMVEHPSAEAAPSQASQPQQRGGGQPPRAARPPITVDPDLTYEQVLTRAGQNGMDQELFEINVLGCTLDTFQHRRGSSPSMADAKLTEYLERREGAESDAPPAGGDGAEEN